MVAKPALDEEVLEGKEVRRGKNGRFLKVRRLQLDRREVVGLARSMSREALVRLGEIMNDDRARDRDRIAAANAILDRAFGKPPQAVAVASEGQGDIILRFSGIDRPEPPERVLGTSEDAGGLEGPLVEGEAEASEEKPADRVSEEVEGDDNPVGVPHA